MAGREQLALFDSLPSTAFGDDAAALQTASPTTRAQVQAPPHFVSIQRPAVLPAGCRWHEVDAAEQRIGFMLRTSRRKTVGLTITDDGLMVTAPTWVARKQVEEVVKEKSTWILRKLRVLHERQQHLATADACWRDGGRFPYLGVKVSLAIRPEIGSIHYEGDADHPRESDTLMLPLQADSSPDRIRERVYAWLQLKAAEHFEARLTHFCQMAGVALRSWRLAAPNGRWGSCSSDARIMLNWRLIHLSTDIVDYVVAHEVAHLRHMNHGPEFWREVGRLYPDFARARQALKPHHPGSLPLL